MAIQRAASQNLLHEMVAEIEGFAKSHELNHRFVGGVSFGGLLNEETTYEIDIEKRHIKLKNYSELQLIRSDKSVKDIDLIVLTQRVKRVHQLRTFLEKLKWSVRLKIGFTPPISYEGLFDKNNQPTGLLEYVTTIHVADAQPYLVFDKVRQRISWDTLEPWTLELENGLNYTVRNPIADYWAYQFRSPAGLKPKDIEKIVHLHKLVQAIVREGKRYGIDYADDAHYGTWQTFVAELASSTIPSVKTKRAITKWYWSTLGTTFAHGRGIIGKPIFALFNLINRLK